MVRQTTDTEDELIEAITDATKSIDGASRTEKIRALRAVLRSEEGDLLSRDDITPDDVEAIGDVIAYAAGVAKSEDANALYRPINRASAAMDMDTGDYAIRIPDHMLPDA